MALSNKPSDPAMDLLDKVRAQYDHISEVSSNLSMIGGKLDKLVKLGDVVTEDEIIKTAGEIVGKGLMPADQMAGLLADMPQNGGGAALAKWVGVHAQEIAQQMEMVGKLKNDVQYQLGVNGSHVIKSAMGMPDQAMADQAVTGQSPTDNPLMNLPPAGSA